MAVEDRERLFEKALAQHLRGSNAESPAWPGVCPDAEMLAAYHENTLAAEQAGVAKQHIQTCQRCQAILEQLKATEEIPLGVPAATARAPRTEGAGGVHVLKPRRVQLWRWVAPAGALAAAVLVWVGVRENFSLHKPATTEVAKAIATAPPQPPSMQSVPESIARAKPPQDAPLVAQLASPSPSTDAIKSRVKSPAEDKNAMAYSGDAVLPASESPAAPRPSGIAGARPEAPGRAESRAEAEELTRETAAAELKQKLDTASNTLQETVPAPQNRRQQSAVTGGALDRAAVAESGPPSSRTSAKKEKAAVPAAPPAVAQEQQMQGMSRYKERAATVLTKTRSANVIIVTSPSTLSVWRLGFPQAILHSADAGKTWTQQISGTDATLLAGAATSDQICWIAGKAGTVLRTTDGGAHWEKVSSPTEEDLTSVTAVDARQATVSTAVGAYQTTDGGVTWHPLASE